MLKTQRVFGTHISDKKYREGVKRKIYCPFFVIYKDIEKERGVGQEKRKDRKILIHYYLKYSYEKCYNISGRISKTS